MSEERDYTLLSVMLLFVLTSIFIIHGVAQFAKLIHQKDILIKDQGTRISALKNRVAALEKITKQQEVLNTIFHKTFAEANDTRASIARIYEFKRMEVLNPEEYKKRVNQAQVMQREEQKKEKPEKKK